MYTVDELLKLKTIGIHQVYGEKKIDTDKERVYLNGRRVAIESYVEDGNFWDLEIQ